MATRKQQLTIDGHRIPISNPDKIFYPGGRFTKADVIDYYIRIFPFLLPQLKIGPITLIEKQLSEAGTTGLQLANLSESSSETLKPCNMGPVSAVRRVECMDSKLTNPTVISASGDLKWHLSGI